jgi:Poly (ADP-ribose) glycohydrolase (PARG)
MTVEKSANPEKLSDLNPFAVLINKAMMITTRVTITPTPWNGTSTSRTHIVDAIEYVLVTAFTAFRAAALESARSRGARSPVVVHTGFWGCGEFGGHRVLMTTLQVLAAEMAGLHQIVLHTGDHTGAAAVSKVRRFLKEHLFDGSPLAVGEAIHRIEGVGFEWGVSDGN